MEPGRNLLGPSVFLETFPQDSDTDKGHTDWQSMSGSRVGAWSLLRAESLVSSQRGTRKVNSVICLLKMNTWVIFNLFYLTCESDLEWELDLCQAAVIRRR